MMKYFSDDKLHSIKADAVVNGRKSTITALYTVDETELRIPEHVDVHLHLFKNGEACMV